MLSRVTAFLTICDAHVAVCLEDGEQHFRLHRLEVSRQDGSMVIVLDDNFAELPRPQLDILIEIRLVQLDFRRQVIAVSFEVVEAPVRLVNRLGLVQLLGNHATVVNERLSK